MLFSILHETINLNLRKFGVRHRFKAINVNLQFFTSQLLYLFKRKPAKLLLPVGGGGGGDAI